MAKSRKSVDYPDIVRHAAAALDAPHDDLAVKSFADHLSEKHPGQLADLFQKWANGEIDHTHFIPLIKEQSKVGLHPGYNPGGTNLRQHALDPGDGSVLDFRLKSLKKGSEGYARSWDNPNWFIVRSTPNHTRLTYVPVARRNPLSTLEVARRVYETGGPLATVISILGARVFHPSSSAERTEGGGNRRTTFQRRFTVNRLRANPAGRISFSRGRKSTLKRFAKVDSHQPAHASIAGFPLEYALRHLANDPHSSMDIRNLSKAMLKTGDPTTLLLLHDALQEGDATHPSFKAYKWHSAADKIELDRHTARALEEEAEAQRRAAPDAEHFETLPGGGRRYLRQFRPESHAVVLANALYPGGLSGHQQALQRVRARVSELSPRHSREDVDDSIRRHGARAVMAFWHEANVGRPHPYQTRAHEPYRPDANLHQAAQAMEKAARYRRKPRRYAESGTGSPLEESKIPPHYKVQGDELVAHTQNNNFRKDNERRIEKWTPKAHGESLRWEPAGNEWYWNDENEPASKTNQTRKELDSKHPEHESYPESDSMNASDGYSYRELTPEENEWAINTKAYGHPEGPQQTQEDLAGHAAPESFYAMSRSRRFTVNQRRTHRPRRYAQLPDVTTNRPEYVGRGNHFAKHTFGPMHDGTPIIRVWYPRRNANHRLHWFHARSVMPDGYPDRESYPPHEEGPGPLNQAEIDRYENSQDYTGPEHLRRHAKPRKYANTNRGSFLDTLRRATSSNQVVMRTAAKKIAGQLGIKPLHVYRGLHDTPHGSVPGVVLASYSQGTSPEAYHELSSWLGNLSQSPGQAVFHIRPDGPDTLYRMRQEGSGHDIRARLDRWGIASRVLVPHRKGFDVLVPVRTPEGHNKVQGYAAEQGTPLESSKGHLAVIGSADQGEARAKYRDTIAKAENRRMKRAKRPAGLARSK